MSAGATLYSRLRDYLLTQEQLKENGYPFPHPERPGGAVIFTAEEKKPKDRESPWGVAWTVGCRQVGWGGSHRPLWLLAQPSAHLPSSTHVHPQPPAESAAAVALSTSCPPLAAASEMRSVTTTGGGSAGTEVGSEDPRVLARL